MVRTNIRIWGLLGAACVAGCGPTSSEDAARTTDVDPQPTATSTVDDDPAGSTSTSEGGETSDADASGTSAAGSSNGSGDLEPQTSTGSDGSGSSSTGPAQRPEPDPRLLHCGAGGGNVVMLDLDGGDAYSVAWEWIADEASGWASDIGDDFSTITDCKMVEDGTQLAIAGRRAVALLDYPSGDVVVHGPVPAAHSVALLPGGRLVGVGSSSALIRLFEIGRPDEVIWEDEMASAHGAVWDPERQRLYVVGHDRMRQYTLRDWDSPSPALELASDLELPDRGAHDLSPVAGSATLLLSTRVNVWRFDRDNEFFSPYALLADDAKVKSVDVHPLTGRVAVSQADRDYWTAQIRLYGPDASIGLPESERLYKLRWFQRATSAALE